MKLESTQLVCPECGNIVTIQRSILKLKAVGHIKDLYCFKCKRVTKHFEIRDVSTFMISHNANNIEEEKIYRLILEKRKNGR